MTNPTPPTTYSEMSDLFTAALEKRERQPHSIARNTLHNWVSGSYEPNYLLLEWIAEHAEHEQTREYASELLKVLDGHDDETEPEAVAGLA